MLEGLDLVVVGSVSAHSAEPRVVVKERLASCYADGEGGVTAGADMSPVREREGGGEGGGGGRGGGGEGR